MANTTDPILHVEIVQGVSKAGKPYETPLAVSSQLHWKCALSKPLCKMNQT